MVNNIIVHPQFERNFKHLAKKYDSFSDDVRELVEDLKINSKIGTPLGRSVRKIRLRIKSKGSGKSGGARIITYVVTLERTVYLLSVYDKSERASIAETEIMRLVDQIKSGLI